MVAGTFLISVSSRQGDPDEPDLLNVKVWGMWIYARFLCLSDPGVGYGSKPTSSNI